MPKIMEDSGRQARILQPERSCGDENIEKRGLYTESKIKEHKNEKAGILLQNRFSGNEKGFHLIRWKPQFEAGLEGFEPSKLRSQSPLPYRLAIAL